MERSDDEPPQRGTWRPRLGDPVRVRADVGSLMACDEMAHVPEEAGATGVVVAVRAVPGTPGHPYLVMFHRPRPAVLRGARSMPIGARHYAADELEPMG
jgi:hypothetical protein